LNLLQAASELGGVSENDNSLILDAKDGPHAWSDSATAMSRAGKHERSIHRVETVT
jgi:hypothetical protein